MKKIASGFILIACTLALFALDVPTLTSPVMDLAGIVDSSDKSNIKSQLMTLQKDKNIQIAVLTIPSLEGENLEEYTNRVFNSWGLGDKENDSGVLLLVSVQDRKIRIEVGYGMEDTVTDAIASKIIRSVILPEFKNGNYSQGIAAGIHVLTATASHSEDSMLLANERVDLTEEYGMVIVILVIAALVFPILLFLFLSLNIRFLVIVFAVLGGGSMTAFLVFSSLAAAFPYVHVAVPAIPTIILGILAAIGSYKRTVNVPLSTLRKRMAAQSSSSRRRGGGYSSSRGGGYSGGGGSSGGGGASGSW